MSLLLLFQALEGIEGAAVAGFDYSRMVATASRLITRFGQAGTLERPTFTGPSHTPVAGTPEEYPAIFVIGEFKSREIDGTRVLQGDKRVIIAPSLAVVPKLSDWLVEADGGRFRLVDFKTIKPATTTIAYIAQVRR